MIYIVITAILSPIVAVLCFYIIENNYKLSGNTEFMVGIFGILAGLICITSLFACPICGFDWVASDYKAKIINEEFGTSYTREEIFYGSSVIDKIQEIKRQRIEINGNLITGE